MEAKVKKAADKAHYLDQETRATLTAVRKKNSKAVTWFIISWTILLLVGLGGIYQQNRIANQNKKHIDCIVKLLASPLPIGARARVLTNPSTTCNIKFTQ